MIKNLLLTRMRLEIRAMAVKKIRKWRVKRRNRKLPLSLLLMEGMALVMRRSSTLMVLIMRRMTVKSQSRI
jgi:hypothetical protein